MVRVAAVVGQVPEYVVNPRRRRRRHHHRVEAPPKRLMCPGPITANGPQGLQERLRAMRFVEQDKAVVGNESRVDRPGSGTAAVGAKQQPGADLVHRRGDDGRLQRVARPGFRSIHAAAQRVHGERPLAPESGGCAVGDASQIVRDDLQNAVYGLLQLLRQPARTFICFVDDHPSIHHEEDAAWRGDRLPGIQPRRLSRQGEQGDVHAGGFPGCSRQGDSVGPGRRRCSACARRSVYPR